MLLAALLLTNLGDLPGAPSTVLAADGGATSGSASADQHQFRPMRDFMGANTSLFIHDNGLIEETARPFKWIREYHKWQHLEPVNDRYLWDSKTSSPYGGTWPNHHDFIQSCVDHGIRILIAVEQATTWASSDGTVTGLPISSGDGSAESHYAERAEYVAQLAARYGSYSHEATSLETPDALSGQGLVHHFEDFNEQNQTWQVPRWPADKYARFLGAVHDGTGVSTSSRLPLAGVKSGDPNAVHVMGGLAGADTEYLDRILQETAGTLPADVINIHLYATDYQRAFAPEHPEFGLKPGIDKILGWRDAKAPGKEVWLTEFGWDTYIDGPAKSYVAVPEISQANYLMRAFALLRQWGVDKAFMYIFADPSSEDPLQYASSGVIKDKAHGFARKPSYYYLSTMQAVVGDLCLTEGLQADMEGLHVYSYLFSNGSESEQVRMLWARNPADDVDSGVTFDGWAQAVPNAGSCEVILPRTGSLTGEVSDAAVENPGSPEARVVLPRLTETPVFLRCQVEKPQYGQIFPFSQDSADSFQGVAVSSFSEQTVSLQFSAYHQDGAPAAAIPEHTEVHLLPAAQHARLVKEIFPAEPGLPPKWILLTSDSPETAGFFLYGNNRLTRMDGAVSATRAKDHLYITRALNGETAFRGNSAHTVFWIVNPGSEPVTLELRLVDGSMARTVPPAVTPITKPAVIPAKGMLKGTVDGTFGLADSLGYIEVRVIGGGAVAGFELIELADGDTGAGLNAVEPGTASQLFSAQAAHSGSIFTHLRLLNTAQSDRTVILSAIAEDGGLIGTSDEISISPGEVFDGDLGDLIRSVEDDPEANRKPVGEFIGSLVVDADGPGIIGDVIFGDPLTHRFAAAQPLQTEAASKAVFSHVANSARFFTGLAIFNPGETGASISVDVLQPDGQLKGQTAFDLPPRNRASSLLSEMIPESKGQAGGQIILRSTVPIVAQQLFGDLDLNLMAAVPPAIVE